MKVKTAHPVILALFGIIAFSSVSGCSDDGSTDTVEQSTDDILSTDSDANPPIGSDSSIPVDDTNIGDSAADTASGQLPGDTSQDSDTTVSSDSTVIDTADTNDTSAPMDTATGTGTNAGSDSDSPVDTVPADSDTVAPPDTSDDSEGATDSGIDTGDPTDTETDPVDTSVATDSDTAMGTDADTDSDSMSDESDTDCPFICRSDNWCTANEGFVSEDFICEEPNQVCCEVVADDTETETEVDTSADTEPGDTGTEAELTCVTGCHSASWCYSNDATIYEELTCTGNQICCEVVVDEQ